MRAHARAVLQRLRCWKWARCPLLNMGQSGLGRATNMDLIQGHPPVFVRPGRFGNDIRPSIENVILYLGSSETTNIVANDRDCRPRQTLLSTTNFVFDDSRKRLMLSPTTKFVTKDKVCHKIKRQDLSSTTNFVFWETVVHNNLCRRRQTLLSATQIVQNDTFSRFRWTQVICKF